MHIFSHIRSNFKDFAQTFEKEALIVLYEQNVTWEMLEKILKH